MKLSDMARRTREHRKEEIARTSTLEHPLQRPSTVLEIPAPAHGLRIAVITDTQVRKGVPMEHIKAGGKYIARKQPDVNVFVGDWWDMPSCGTHDAPGSVRKENARYWDDISAGRYAMDLIKNEYAKVPGYKPVDVFLMGNHEYRIDRAIAADPTRLMGVISTDDFGLAGYGFKVYPFLQPVVIGGTAFCHFFPRGVMGRPISSPSILLKELHMSAFAGHQQGRQIAYGKRGDGKDLTAIISGSFYQHDEDYLSPFTNQHWRGFYMLNEVKDGSYDEMAVSINFLLRKFK